MKTLPAKAKEIVKNKNSLSIMAIDNLPSELPKDSSKELDDNTSKAESLR